MVYVEPYPKSKAIEFHSDAIAPDENAKPPLVTFEPFVGVGPRKFFDLFSMKLSTGFEMKRKGEDGRIFEWQHDGSCARIQMLPRCYLDQETEATAKFAKYQEGLVSGNGKDTG